MRRRLLLAVAVTGTAALAYAAYRIGSAYDRDDPIAGLAAFARTAKAGAAERERDLRDALGMEATAAAQGTTAAQGTAAAGGTTRHTVEARSLDVDEARALLRDPAGPDPRRMDDDAR